MIQGVGSANEHFLNALSRLQDRLQTVQRQLSSGIRIERASDAPDRIVDVIRRQSQMKYTEQVKNSMGRLKAEVDIAEATLQQAVKVIEGAIASGVGALGSAFGQTDLQTLAEPLRVYHDELVRLSGTRADGRYIFGGDDDQQAPYQLNLANPNGVDRLSTAPATRLVLDFDGSRFAAGRTAQEIFDHRLPDDSLAPDNAFAALNSLRAAIEAGDRSQAEAAINSLGAAHAHVSQQLMFYGSVQNRVADSINQGHAQEVRIQSELSEIRETDLAAAAVELGQIQISIEAALRTQASTSSMPTLFDYLR